MENNFKFLWTQPQMCTENSKTHSSFIVWYIDNFLGYRTWMITPFHEEFVCMWSSCEHVFIWDFLTLWTSCKWSKSCQLCHTTCQLWSVQQQLQFAFAAPEQCVGCAVHTIFEIAPKEIIAVIHVWWTWWQDNPHLTLSGNLFTRTWLPNTLWRTFSMTLLYVGMCTHALFPEWLGMTFCSCCRYYWFVMVPFTRISPISPCLMMAHHMVNFARWSDIFTTLCGFLEDQNLMFCLFMNPSRW